LTQIHEIINWLKCGPGKELGNFSLVHAKEILAAYESQQDEAGEDERPRYDDGNESITLANCARIDLSSTTGNPLEKKARSLSSRFLFSTERRFGTSPPDKAKCPSSNKHV
jgi:hypothetical protein